MVICTGFESTSNYLEVGDRNVGDVHLGALHREAQAAVQHPRGPPLAAPHCSFEHSRDRQEGSGQLAPLTFKTEQAQDTCHRRWQTAKLATLT